MLLHCLAGSTAHKTNHYARRVQRLSKLHVRVLNTNQPLEIEFIITNDNYSRYDIFLTAVTE